ncbi:phosphatidic acid phosphatase type 2/haloperoxidase [Podospora australis]|uniref:Phosphatidic acid phosphatase type 2/haloperoxidase n=1 Tax=Podospora australis TaxID=1536484 RepID=A0AAN7AGS1_9PEZI|nr:phosphatidic acid phosphatase type 2/haloperoxidase [Podospora australis]
MFGRRRNPDPVPANGSSGAVLPTPKHEHNGTRRSSSSSSRLIQFIKYWIIVSWIDLLAMGLLGGAALGIYEAPLAATRNFPITFSASGDIVYPEFAYPNRGWIISPAASGAISAVIPIGIILLAQIRIRSFWDMNNAIMGVLYSLIISTLFQVVIKQLIGGFRPYFLSICQPDISLASTHNTTGLNGVGFQQIMYTSEICTNPDKKALKTAMTSFPSGHSTSAWAGLFFLFLWMNAKLKVWGNFRSSFFSLALLWAPILGATLMAACLTIDQAHNWYDIVAGSVIGTLGAITSYRVLYAAVWDWRYNHIPLKRREVFDYAAAAVGKPEKAVFIRKLGWGRRKKAATTTATRTGYGKRESRGTRSERSSATYARNGSGVSPHSRVPAHQPMVPSGHGSGMVHEPQPATVRGTNGQYYTRGDDMV